MGDLPQDYNDIKRELARLKVALRDTSEHLGVVEVELHRARLMHNAVDAKFKFWRSVAIIVNGFLVGAIVAFMFGVA